MTGAQPSCPFQDRPPACSVLHQDPSSDAGICLSAPAHAGSPLPCVNAPPEAHWSTRDIRQAVSPSSSGDEMEAATPQDCALASDSNELAGNGRQSSGICSSVHDGGPFCDDAELRINFNAATAASSPCERSHTAAQVFGLEQGLTGGRSRLVRQGSLPSSPCTVSLDTSMPAEPFPSRSRGSSSSSDPFCNAYNGTPHERHQPDACATDSPRSRTFVQPPPEGGSTAPEDTCRIERQSATLEFFCTPARDALGTVSHDRPSPTPARDSAPPGPLLGAPRMSPSAITPPNAATTAATDIAPSAAVSPPSCAAFTQPSCTTPCLVEALASPQSNHPGPLAHSSLAMPCSSQDQPSEVGQASAQSSFAGRGTAAAPDGLTKRASCHMHSVSSALDVFSTPQLSLPSAEAAGAEPSMSASPARNTPTPNDKAPALAVDGDTKQDLDSTQPRDLFKALTSHMPSEHRRAKARASVSFASHSLVSLPNFKTPYGSAAGKRRPRGSVCRPALLALPDACPCRGPSHVEVIPEASICSTEEEEASLCHTGSPEVLSPLAQALQACGQVRRP